MKQWISGVVAMLVAGIACPQQPTQWPPESLKITVKFGDGSTVPLTLRTNKQSYWSPDPTQDGPSNVARLVPLANAGDAGAAFGISQFLNDCKSAARNEAQLAEWIKLMREKNVLTWREGQTSPMPAGLSADQQEKTYRDKFRQCKGLKPADLDQADQWQRKAADGGHLWALIYLYQDNKSGLTEAQRLEIARKTWDIGDMSGLERIASTLEKINRVESMGYAVLNERMNAAVFEAANNPGTKFRAESAARQLGNKMRELTPDEQKRAMAAAKPILLKNKACCFVQ